MGCSRNEYCKTIADDYGTKKISIDKKLNDMQSNISLINDSLNSFEVPDDYVGSKVKEKIAKITERFDNNSTNIDVFKNNINKFIDEKASEHKRHYLSWKESINVNNDSNSIDEEVVDTTTSEE